MSTPSPAADAFALNLFHAALPVVTAHTTRSRML